MKPSNFSLNKTIQQGFLIKYQCVYCKVQTEEKSRFDPGAIHVELGMDKLFLGQVFF